MLTDYEFKGLTDDLTYKYVFSKNVILKDFINSFLEYIEFNYRFNFSNIIPESFIMPNNQKLKCYYGDIVGTLDNGDIVSLEMYKNRFTKNDYNKSFNYMNRLFDNQITKGKNYKNAKKVISISLITGNFRRCNNKLVNCYKFKNDLTNKVIDNGNTEMYLVRLDLVSSIPYNISEKRFIKWLRLINAKTIEEMKFIAGDDEIMNDSIKFVTEWCRKSGKNGMARYIEEQREDASEKGLKKGILTTVKNLLALDVDVETISKATGLSIKQIKALK